MSGYGRCCHKGCGREATEPLWLQSTVDEESLRRVLDKPELLGRVLQIVLKESFRRIGEAGAERLLAGMVGLHFRWAMCEDHVAPPPEEGRK